MNQDESIKRRFYLYSENEDRSFEFESILDTDHADWFYAIEANINVLTRFFSYLVSWQ